MTMKVALLRGVNVGGRNKLPMKTLVDALESLDCRNVRTYIQSGNAVFIGAAQGPAIASEISRRVGFAPPVFVVDAKSLVKAAALCPFKDEAAASPTSVHVFFLENAPEGAAVEALGALRRGDEDFAVAGTVLYHLAPNGFAASEITARIDRVLKTKTTARNWRTVAALIALTKGAA